MRRLVLILSWATCGWLVTTAVAPAAEKNPFQLLGIATVNSAAGTVDATPVRWGRGGGYGGSSYYRPSYGGYYPSYGAYYGSYYRPNYGDYNTYYRPSYGGYYGGWSGYSPYYGGGYYGYPYYGGVGIGFRF